MPTIAIQNGKIVFRESKAATDTECCCGCCCVEGVPDPTKTTRSQCENNGGIWNPGPACGDVCFCCYYGRFVCHERVYSYYDFAYPPADTVNYPAPQPIPADQPEGTLCVEGLLIPTDAEGPISTGCAGTVPAGSQYDFGLYSINCGWADPCSVESGRTAYHSQWYDRWRVVDDCEECATDLTYEHSYGLTECPAPPGGDPFTVGPNEGCPVGVEAIECIALTKNVCLDLGDCMACADQLGISLCENPLP